MNKVKSYFKNNYIFYIIAFIVLAIDLITKHILTNKNIVLIPNVLSFKYSENTGAAFSMFSNNTVFLIIVSVILLIGVILYKSLINHKPHLLFTLAYPLIVGGAIGNLLDRIIFGYVRDFISLDIINFAIFNIADSALCIGFILLAFYMVFIDFKEEKKLNKN